MDIPLDAVGIQRILPHRYPFLLVDRIIEFVAGERIVGLKQLTMGDQFFQGHFPGSPVMPGVLIVEALAQVGAVYVLSQMQERENKLVLFSGIDAARFRRPVVPGDSLRLEVTPIRVGARVQKMRGVASVEGQMAAEAEIMSVVVDRANVK